MTLKQFIGRVNSIIEIECLVCDGSNVTLPDDRAMLMTQFEPRAQRERRTGLPAHSDYSCGSSTGLRTSPTVSLATSCFGAISANSHLRDSGRPVELCRGAHPGEESPSGWTPTTNYLLAVGGPNTRLRPVLVKVPLHGY